MELKGWIENWNQSIGFLRHYFRFDRSDILVFMTGFLFSLPTLLQLEIPEVFFMFGENHIRLIGVEESRNLVHQYTVVINFDSEAVEQNKGLNPSLSLPCLVEKILNVEPSFLLNSNRTYSTEFTCFLLNNSLNLKQCPIRYNIDHLSKSMCAKSYETVNKIHDNSTSIVWALLQDFETGVDKTVREHMSSLFNDVLLDLKAGLSMINGNVEVLRDQKTPYIVWVAGMLSCFRDQQKFDLTSLNMLDIDTLIVTTKLGMNRRVLAITFEFEKTTSTLSPFCLPMRGTIFHDNAKLIDISVDTQPIVFSQVGTVPVCYNSLKHTVAMVSSGFEKLVTIDHVLKLLRTSTSQNAADKFEFSILGHLSAYVGNQNLDFRHLSTSLWRTNRRFGVCAEGQET